MHIRGRPVVMFAPSSLLHYDIVIHYRGGPVEDAHPRPPCRYVCPEQPAPVV